ncbi:MAG: winged helix-turn-helix domain-containing protein [Chloroflexota bacterium]
MTLTVRQRIADQGTGLVGREPERAFLHLVLGEEGPLVVFIHGIGGVGKSALLEAFTAEARAHGATVLRLDSGGIEPTTRGFLEALSTATGSELGSVEDAAARLAGLGQRVILVLDRYEVLRPLDQWLQQTFVPALSDSVRVVFAGREPPMAGWSVAMGRLFRTLPLANLPRDDAETLLRQDGVTGDDLERINRLARGHPLSLRLAASALVAGPAFDHDATTVTTIVEELTELYLAQLDPPTRRALDAASVVRRPTLSLMGAMLPDAAPQDAFDRLRSLPFVELSDDGLVLHDTVRETVAAYLRATDPDRSRRHRIAAWRQLRDEVARAPSHEMWRYTADLLYILENPNIREAFFPTTEHLYFVDAAQPDDWPVIHEIAMGQQSPAPVAILAEWWRRLPQAFRTARDGAGAIAGFSVLTELDHVPRGLFDVDPVARVWRDHVRRLPVPRGQRILTYRFGLADPQGMSQSLVMAAIMLDIKRLYMELRPELRRIYTNAPEIWGNESPWTRVGFVPLPGGPVALDGTAYHAYVLDFGPASVDGWLTRIIATELQIEEDSILDIAQHQLILGGRRVDLTKLEFEVLRYLYERPGKVVERSSLLRDVWGYDYVGGSNVIEALVKSIRRKLGDRAAAIETVRGLGYRFVVA